jgi:4-diphosphocytidyl-2-C-methyl-D-erythritol kinase
LRVSQPLLETAPAKINLTLRVLGRRADGYHDLESLVAFATLADTLQLEPGATPSLEITGPFAAACGALGDNLVLKAVSALAARVGTLKSGRFLLDKQIPVAGGVGGGSADAAAALRLLARLNTLAQDDPRLAAAALAGGADVPVCLDARPRIMRGVGEQLSEPLSLPPLPAILANPRVPLATRDVFKALVIKAGGKQALPAPPRDAGALIDYLAGQGNDLTEPAIASVAAVGDMLSALAALPQVCLARMSGSGPTCFALFSSATDARAAARLLQGRHKDWWVVSTTIGGS